MSSRTFALGALAVAAVAGLVAAGGSSTGVALLSLAAVAAVFAVPPRARVLLGVVLVGVGVLVGTTAERSSDLAATVSVVALVAAGAVTALRGRRWPPLARRYGESTTREGAMSGGSDGRPELLWQALDRGEDPTADDAPDPDDRGHGRTSVD